MSEIKMNRTKNTVKASAHLPGGAYKCALALVSAYDGEIVKSADNLFRAKFTDTETAEKFKNEWTASYAAAHAAYVPKSKRTPKKSKSKPFNFSQIKGNTTKEKNKALHATLVGMGITDSRTPEYQAVWSARPWKK